MFVRLSFFYFFYFAIIGVYVIYMPKAFAMAGYTNAQIGVLMSAAPLMRFLVPFLFLKHIRLTPRVYLTSLLLLVGAALLFYPAFSSFGWLLAINIFYGSVIGISLPYVETIALEKLERKVYGRSRLFGSIGFIVVALWLGEVLKVPGDVLFYFVLTSALTAGAGAWVLALHRKNRAVEAASGQRFSLLDHWPLWVSLFLMQVSFGGFYNFFTIHATEHGISLSMTSWLWSFGVICEIVMLYFQGPLLHRNLLTVIRFAILSAVIRWSMLWLFPASLPVLFAAQSLHAISFALYHSASITLLFSLYRQKALAQQFFLGIAYGLGGFVGALFAGLAYGPALFGYEALVALVAFAVLYGQRIDFSKPSGR